MRELPGCLYEVRLVETNKSALENKGALVCFTLQSSLPALDELRLLQLFHRDLRDKATIQNFTGQQLLRGMFLWGPRKSQVAKKGESRLDGGNSPFRTSMERCTCTNPPQGLPLVLFFFFLFFFSAIP